MKRICVFCGSKSGTNPKFLRAANELGKLLVTHGITLVYGGAKVGLMGAVADSALSHGGKVIGVIPKHLQNKEIVHSGLSELHLVNSMHERKAMMAELSDAFIALPGGLGTFEEFFEIITWAQLGLHQKPAGILNIENYYSPLIDLVERGIKEGFILKDHRELLISATDPETLLMKFQNYQPVDVRKWLTNTSET